MENDSIPMKNSALAAIANKRTAQEAGTKSDPVIKTSQTTDPDTGAVTYRQSWDNTSVSASKSTAAPVRRTNASPSISTVGSKAKSSKVVTPGSREVTSVPIPTASGTKKPDITAPLMKKDDKFVPTTQKEKVAENKVSDYNKNKSADESFDQYRKRIQERANTNAEKAKSHEGGGSILTDKSRGTTCTTCK